MLIAEQYDYDDWWAWACFSVGRVGPLNMPIVEQYDYDD
jgi:hypothetical protein